MIWEEYKKLLPKYSDKDLKFIEAGFELAQIAYEDRKRASGEEYICHPIEVSLSVAKIGLDPNAVITALLHEAMEKSLIEIKTIRKKFQKVSLKTKYYSPEIHFSSRVLPKIYDSRWKI